MAITAKKIRKQWQYRHLIYGVVIVAYFIPVLLYNIYNAYLLPEENRLSLFLIGLLVSIVGSATVIFLIRNWEFMMRARAERLVEEKVASIIENQKANQQEDETILVAEEAILHRSHSPSDTEDWHSSFVELKEELEKKSQYYGQEVSNLRHELSQSEKLSQSLISEVSAKEDKVRKLGEEKQQLASHCKKVTQELQTIKNQLKNEVRVKEQAMLQHEQELVQQAEALAQKKENIESLQTRIYDLDYEVKMLLELKEVGGIPWEGDDNLVYETKDVAHFVPVPLSTQVSVQQLSQCVAIATEMSGAAGQGLGLRADSHVIDQRRLFERYQGISKAVVFLFSPKEEKLKFVSRHIKELVGWAPERFSIDFLRLIESSLPEWQEGLDLVKVLENSEVRLFVKTKSGEILRLNCHIARISHGIFADHVVGIVSPCHELIGSASN